MNNKNTIKPMLLSISDLALYLPYNVELRYSDLSSDRKIIALLTGLSTVGIETTYRRKKGSISGDLISFSGNNNIQDLNVQLKLYPLSHYVNIPEILDEMTDYEINMIEDNPDLTNKLSGGCIRVMLMHHIDIYGFINKGIGYKKI
jgi:hypothetical protein